MTVGTRMDGNTKTIPNIPMAFVIVAVTLAIIAIVVNTARITESRRLLNAINARMDDRFTASDAREWAEKLNKANPGLNVPVPRHHEAQTPAPPSTRARGNRGKGYCEWIEFKEAISRSEEWTKK